MRIILLEWFRGPVWRWGGEFGVPNASLWRKPWGFYLRLPYLRVLIGPRFKVKVRVERA